MSLVTQTYSIRSSSRSTRFHLSPVLNMRTRSNLNRFSKLITMKRWCKQYTIVKVSAAHCMLTKDQESMKTVQP